VKLIVGLGNVGERYATTRHNVGFMVVDRLARLLEGQHKTDDKFQAEVTSIGVGDDKILLAKPHTMMNLSGEAVGKLMHFYKIDPADVWIIHDDVDIEFGLLRVRQGGGSAGHNGIKSIMAHVGPDFWRFRVGVHNDRFADTPTDQFVLDGFLPEEQGQLAKIIDQTAAILHETLNFEAPSDTTHPLI
jgi:PTH1 family peptidyl-tRNA hydrolase